MAVTQFQQQILETTKGLPDELMREVIDFIEFLKQKKATYSNKRISIELSASNSFEEQHLMEEFADYNAEFPKEA